MSSEWLWISALISDMEGTNPLTMIEWLALTSDMEGTNPLTMSEWPWDSSLSLRGNLYLENTKLLPEVLEIHSSQWLHQHINYLFLHRNILELHYSPLHHIPDIVILDLDVLRLVMEH